MNRLSRSKVPGCLINLWDSIALIALRLIDRLRRKSTAKKPTKLIRASATSVRLPIRPRRQWLSFSCTSSVLQMTEEFLSGRKLSHFEAVNLMACRPDGASLKKIASVLKKRIRCTSKALRSAREIRQALTKGAPVLASDNFSRPFDHAILLSGFSPRGFYFIDPIDAREHWRSDRQVLRCSDEFIAILPR